MLSVLIWLHRSRAWLGAPPTYLVPAAALAFGIVVGNWVVGPLVSYDVTDRAALRSASAERESIAAASARPDPSPYRTPTPDFGGGHAPNYGAIAKDKAQAALGRRSLPWNAFESNAFAGPESEGDNAPRHRYPTFDRHKVY
jgi:hypothetical protein